MPMYRRGRVSSRQKKKKKTVGEEKRKAVTPGQKSSLGLRGERKSKKREIVKEPAKTGVLRVVFNGGEARILWN